MPRPSSIFRFLLFSFVLGVSVGSFFYSFSPTVPLLCLAFGVAVFGSWPNRLGAIVFLAVVVFSTGFFLVSQKIESARSLRETGSMSGIAEVVRKPETKEFSRDAVLRITSCPSGACPDGLVLAKFSLLDQISFGETGTLSCELSLPEEEWRMYYAKEGISHVCRRPVWSKQGESHVILSRLFSLSSRFEQALSEALPEPESSLAAGLLLGGEGRLPRDIQDAFRTAGLAHIVAVSGYNISIIAGYLLLFGIALSLTRRWAALFGFFGTLGFVLVSGAPPSAVRALGMASVLLFSWWLGRRYGSLSAVLFAAGIMLVFNPLILRFDLGFILSFLATLGIVLLGPFAERLLRNVPFFPRVFLEALSLTVVAELFILPILFANFGGFSAAAFPANAILLPLVPLAMLFSFLSGLLGMFSGSLGLVFAFPAYAFLHMIIVGAEYAASFEKLSFSWDDFGWTEAIIWYSLVGLLVTLLFRNRKGSSIRPIASHPL